MATADVKVAITGDASGFISAAKAAEAELGKIAKASEDAAKAQSEQAKAADEAAKALVQQTKAADKAARATEALTDIAIQQASEEEQLTYALEKKRKEIWELASVSGDAAAAERALVAVEKGHADALDALRKSQDKATQATEEAARAAKDAGTKVESLDDKMDKAGRGAVKMRGALSQVSPEAAELAGLIDDGADAFEGFGAVAGLLGPVIVGLGIGLAGTVVLYKSLTEEQERSERITASVNQANMELESVYKTERDAVLALKIATGQLTDEQGALVAMQQTAMEAFRENTKATRAQITSLREEQLSMTTAVVDGLQEWGAKWGYVGAIQTAALDALTTDSEEYEQQIDALTGVVDKATASTVNTVKAQREAVKATKDRTKAVKEQKEALEEVGEVSVYTSLVAARTAYDELIALAEKQTAADVAETDARVRAEREAAQELIDIGDSMLAEVTSATKQAQVEVLNASESIAGSVSDLTGLALDAAVSQAEATQDALAATEERLVGIRDLMAGLNTDTVDAADLAGKALVDAYKSGEVAAEDLSAAQKSAIAATLKAEEDALVAKQTRQEKQLEQEKKIALRLFRIQQALQIAQSVGSAAAFILQGGAQLGIPGAIAAGIAAAAQVTAIAAAEPPSFRRGGTALPDERRVVAQVEDGEALQVTSRQGVAKANSDAHNAGLSAPGARGDVRLVLNGRDIGRMIEAGVQSAKGRQAVTTSAARGRAPRRAA